VAVIKLNLPDLWHRLDEQLFPPLFGAQRHVTLWEYLLILGVSTFIFSAVGFFVKADGFLGYDWYHYYSKGVVESFYPPWTVCVKWLSWPGLIGLSCAALVIAFYRRYASPLIMAVSFLSWPVLWLLFVGQLDGLVLLGLTGLPWLIPLATLKPQISAFAFLASKQRLLAFAVWITLTLLIWGMWPVDMLNYQNQWETLYEGAKQPQNISLWPWSLLLAPFLLWFSRGDTDMLMLAGALITPHLVPYSFVVVLPAVARVSTWLALTLVAISWLPISANWVGDWGWYLGHLFPLILWTALYRKRKKLEAGTQRQ